MNRLVYGELTVGKLLLALVITTVWLLTVWVLFQHGGFAADPDCNRSLPPWLC